MQDTNTLKYPRTVHFPFSPGATNDDKVCQDLSFLEGEEVIISEKMDGENSSLTRIRCYARSIDSNNHPSRNWLKGLWGNIRFDIPENWRICGENLYARHSIAYDNLDSYFYVFNIWDENNKCLSWDETVEWCKLMGLVTVPTLYRGIFDLDVIKNLSETIDTNKKEGFVCRIADPFHYDDFSKYVVKWVRKGHVQTDEHWMNSKMIVNGLKK